MRVLGEWEVCGPSYRPGAIEGWVAGVSVVAVPIMNYGSALVLFLQSHYQEVVSRPSDVTRHH